MKKVILLLPILFALNFGCSDPTEEQTLRILSSDQLLQVLERSESFHALVDVHIDFINEAGRTFQNLSDKNRNELLNLVTKQDLNSFIYKASTEDREMVLTLTPGALPKLNAAYNSLIKELKGKYVFDEQDLNKAVIVTFEARYKGVASGRTTQLSCEGHCSNGAESTYWRVYDATGSSDLGAVAANYYYIGCLNGCIHGTP